MSFIKKLILGLVPVSTLFMSAAAFASEGGEMAAGGAGVYGAIGAGIAIGVAAIGGALGQGKAASAALEGMARNPQANLLVPMIIGLALIESLVIYALIIAFQIVGKM